MQFITLIKASSFYSKQTHNKIKEEKEEYKGMEEDEEKRRRKKRRRRNKSTNGHNAVTNGSWAAQT